MLHYTNKTIVYCGAVVVFLSILSSSIVMCPHIPFLFDYPIKSYLVKIKKNSFVLTVSMTARSLTPRYHWNRGSWLSDVNDTAKSGRFFILKIAKKHLMYFKYVLADESWVPFSVIVIRKKIVSKIS